MVRLQFLYVCERQFTGLPGDDPQQRRCDTCATVVHNLDAMTPAARDDLLARAEAERTTVCVSQTAPPELGHTCRPRPPVPVPAFRPGPPDHVPLMGVVAPRRSLPPVEPEPPRPDITRPPVTPPRRDERGAVWRSFGADQPTVDAELAVLAPGFGLTATGEHTWACRDEATDLVVAVASDEAGEQTAVGVRIKPFVSTAVLEVATPVWMLLVVAVVTVVLAAVVLYLGGSVGMLLVVPFVAMAGVGAVSGVVRALVAAPRELRRWRARSRWISAWHRRFWPALAARLAERQPYR